MQTVPESAQVTVRTLPIALWCSDYRVGTDDEPAKMTFEPVRGAYVACIRIESGWRGALSELTRLRCGRTNDYGWVLHRERADLGEEGDTPRSGWRRQLRQEVGVPDHTTRVDREDAGVPRPTNLEMFGPDDPAIAELDSSDANAEALYVRRDYRVAGARARSSCGAQRQSMVGAWRQAPGTCRARLGVDTRRDRRGHYARHAVA